VGASYNTIAVPVTEPERIHGGIADALRWLGCRVVSHEAPLDSADGFQYRSAKTIFVGPKGTSRWVPLSSWGEGLPGCGFPEWYRTNSLAMSLSRILSPVIYFFSYDAGLLAGYSIFREGRHVEFRSLLNQPGLPWEASFVSQVPLRPSSNLADVLHEPGFDYEVFCRGFDGLEVATAALAGRIGVEPHLIDPLDIQDGDGAIIVNNGEYKQVGVPGWLCIFYEKAGA
jgi:hypothetical protein